MTQHRYKCRPCGRELSADNHEPICPSCYQAARDGFTLRHAEVVALKAELETTRKWSESIQQEYGAEIDALKAERDAAQAEAARKDEALRSLKSELDSCRYGESLDWPDYAEKVLSPNPSWLSKRLAMAKAEAWEEVAQYAIEWMKNPGGIDARFIAALRETGKNKIAAPTNLRGEGRKG